MGLYTCSPKRTSLATDPPRWLMPCTSLFFTSSPAAKATSARMSDAFSTPCPPKPAITTLVTWLLLIAPLMFLDQLDGKQARTPIDDYRELRLLAPLFAHKLPNPRLPGFPHGTDAGDAVG